MTPKHTKIALKTSTFEAMIQEWSRVAEYHETANIYLYGQSMAAFRYHDLVQNKALLNKYFHGKAPVFIDVSTYSIEDAVDLGAILDKYEQSKVKPSVYILANMDRYLLEGNHGIFSFLKERHIAHPEISYLLFFGVDFLHPTFARTLSGSTRLQENTIIHPLPSDEDGHEFISYLEQKWTMSVSQKMKSDIVTACARHMWLIKEAMRYVRDHKGCSLGEVLHHDMMRLRVKMTFDALLPSEQAVLKKIEAGANDFTEHEMHSIAFLKKTGWVRASGNRLGIETPILAMHVRGLISPTVRLIYSNNAISLNDVPLNDLFSDKEVRVLRLLLTTPKTVISRDTLAKEIWGDSWEEDYSDWAIDQLVSRVRKKLVRLHIPKQAIKAIKGKGFLYDA